VKRVESKGSFLFFPAFLGLALDCREREGLPLAKRNCPGLFLPLTAVFFLRLFMDFHYASDRELEQIPVREENNKQNFNLDRLNLNGFRFCHKKLMLNDHAILYTGRKLLFNRWVVAGILIQTPGRQKKSPDLRFKSKSGLFILPLQLRPLTKYKNCLILFGCYHTPLSLFQFPWVGFL
jgi:hypothetical protein